MAAKKNKDEVLSATAKSKLLLDGSPDRKSRRDELLLSLNKIMKGRGQIKPASEYTQPYMTKRLPTGLLSLDIELRGGLPAGGISQIAGTKNSGKSYLYWQVVRQLQHILGDDMAVLLAMTEMRADRQQARLAGVKVALADLDIQSMELSRIQNGRPPFTNAELDDMRQQVGCIDEFHGESAEVLFDGIIKAVDADVYNVIVIDSFGSIMTAAEAEADSLDQKHYGGAAKITSEFLRKLTALLTMDNGYGKARDTCIIAVNQIRDAIGDMHKEFRSPGGRALEHAKFVDIFVQSGAAQGFEDSVYTSTGTKKRFVQTGKEINWRIEKGKAGIHEGGKGSYVYDFRINQADFYLDTLVAGVRSGVLEAAGAWIGIPDLNNPGSYIMRANGKEAFINELVKDSQTKTAVGDPNTYMNLIRNLAFKAHDININYAWK